MVAVVSCRSRRRESWPAKPNKLKKRQRQVATEIKAGGTQLTMLFGGESTVDVDEEIETEH